MNVFYIIAKYAFAGYHSLIESDDFSLEMFFNNAQESICSNSTILEAKDVGSIAKPTQC